MTYTEAIERVCAVLTDADDDLQEACQKLREQATTRLGDNFYITPAQAVCVGDWPHVGADKAVVQLQHVGDGNDLVIQQGDDFITVNANGRPIPYPED